MSSYSVSKKLFSTHSDRVQSSLSRLRNLKHRGSYQTKEINLMGLSGALKSYHLNMNNGKEDNLNELANGEVINLILLRKLSKYKHGMENIIEGNYYQAENYYQNIINSSQIEIIDETEIRNNLSICLIMQGKLSSAVDKIKKATSLDSSTPTLFYNLAVSQFIKNKYDKSLRSLSKITLLNMDSLKEAALYLTFLCYLRLCQYDNAAVYFKEYLSFLEIAKESSKDIIKCRVREIKQLAAQNSFASTKSRRSTMSPPKANNTAHLLLNMANQRKHIMSSPFRRISQTSVRRCIKGIKLKDRLISPITACTDETPRSARFNGKPIMNKERMLPHSPHLSNHQTAMLSRLSCSTLNLLLSNGDICDFLREEYGLNKNINIYDKNLDMKTLMLFARENEQLFHSNLRGNEWNIDVEVMNEFNSRLSILGYNTEKAKSDLRNEAKNLNTKVLHHAVEMDSSRNLIGNDNFVNFKENIKTTLITLNELIIIRDKFTHKSTDGFKLILPILKKLNFFQFQTNDLIENIYWNSTYKVYKKEDIVFKQNDEGNTIFIILRGSVIVSLFNPHICKTLLMNRMLSDGDCFSETEKDKDGIMKRANQVGAAEETDMLEIQRARLTYSSTTNIAQSLETEEFLQKLPFFKEAPKGSLTQLISSIRQVNYKYGEKIIQAGEYPDGLYIMYKGEALVYSDNFNDLLLQNKFKGDISLTRKTFAKSVAFKNQAGTVTNRDIPNIERVFVPQFHRLVFEKLFPNSYFGGRSILPYEMTKGVDCRSLVSIIANSPIASFVVIRPSQVALIPSEIKMNIFKRIARKPDADRQGTIAEVEEAKKLFMQWQKFKLKYSASTINEIKNLKVMNENPVSGFLQAHKHM